MKLKKIAILFLVIVTALSFFYSKDFYKAYLNIYYREVIKLKYDDMIRTAGELYTAGKYRELNDYLGRVSQVFDESRDVRFLQALALIKLGNEIRGMELFLASVNEKNITPVLFRDISELMFSHGSFGDICGLMKKFGPGTNPDLLFIYGVSLVKTGRDRESLGVLSRALKPGEAAFPRDRLYDLYFHLGTAFENTGDMTMGLKYYTMARNLKPGSRAINEKLIKMYRKRGMFKEADWLLRNSQ